MAHDVAVASDECHCYRSEHTIGAVVKELTETLSTRPEYEYEIVLVNDGSPDNTAGALEALARHGLLEKSAMVCNCGLEDEAVFPSLTGYDPAQDAGYFATILVKE